MGGLAGTVAACGRGRGRLLVITLGLAGAAGAAVGIGDGRTAAVTVSAAFVVSLLATSAMVRLWAVLADAHRARRAAAMTEGEVSVSIGGIVAPMLLGGLAGTGLTWRFAFAIVALLVLTATVVLATAARSTPAAPQHEQSSPASTAPARSSVRPSWLRPTLVLVFAVVALEFGLSF